MSNLLVLVFIFVPAPPGFFLSSTWQGGNSFFSTMKLDTKRIVHAETSGNAETKYL